MSFASFQMEHQELTSEHKLNFWQDVNAEMPNILRDLSGTVLLAHEDMDFSDIIGLLNKTNPDMHGNVLYISLIRSYNFMKTVVAEKPLYNKDIFFIDCVSGFAFPSETQSDDCLYHKPPSTLQEMKEVISYGIDKVGPNIIIIDSLTQFINFTKSDKIEMEEFKCFLSALRDTTVDGAHNTCLLLYDCRMKKLSYLPEQYTDLIFKIEVENDTTSFEGAVKLL